MAVHPVPTVRYLAGLITLALAVALAQDPFETARQAMVENQIVSRGVQDARVLEAMRTVPRHQFVSPDRAALAYGDYPLEIGFGQTISQPYVVAYMTELLQPQPEQVMLEIGTGSGYQAAVLAELVAQVYTIEIIPELGESARLRLEQLGYQNIQVRIADGWFGWPEAAPFDGIIVTAAAPQIPPPLIEQLKPGGRMVIPVGPPLGAQNLVLVEKAADGTVTTRTLLPVRFVPFVRGP
ncbi:MAG: protein-L-isoaspartate(D-aspartate) O-methyltransferase [Deinococcus sp.]|nr:protein-L-isoaspartate(D-aspartate) O-methyltransferase [Deinococcus sp.]